MLKSILRGDKPEILISRNSLEKILAYARLMKNKECYGFLLAPLNSTDRIVYDAMLCPGQEVTGASVHVEETAVARAKAEIENLRAKALGFWHSHANFNVHHSGVDDHNLDNLVYDFAGNTETEIKGKRNLDGYFIPRALDSIVCLIGDETYEMRLTATKGMEINIEPAKGDDSFSYNPLEKKICVVSRGQMLTIRNVLRPIMEVREPIQESVGGKGFAYSIVVNCTGEIYGEFVEAESCYSCGNMKHKKTKNVLVVAVDVDRDIIFEEEDLRREIKEKIKERTWLKDTLGRNL